MDMDFSDFLKSSGKIRFLGHEINLGKLDADNLAKLREKLRQIGGKALISNEEWKGGGSVIQAQVRGIPPKTSSGMARGHSRPEYQGAFKPGMYRTGKTFREKKKVDEFEVKQEQKPVRQLLLDVFEESGIVKIIGEVPGINEVELIMEIRDGKLIIATKPSSKKRYEGLVDLPKGYEFLNRREVENGILTIELGRKSVRKKKKAPVQEV